MSPAVGLLCPRPLSCRRRATVTGGRHAHRPGLAHSLPGQLARPSAVCPRGPHSCLPGAGFPAPHCRAPGRAPAHGRMNSVAITILAQAASFPSRSRYFPLARVWALSRTRSLMHPGAGRVPPRSWRPPRRLSPGLLLPMRPPREPGGLSLHVQRVCPAPCPGLAPHDTSTGRGPASPFHRFRCRD